MTFRENVRPLIRKHLSESKELKPQERRQFLKAEFAKIGGVYAYHYKIWLDEIRRQLGKKNLYATNSPWPANYRNFLTKFLYERFSKKD